MSAEAFRAQIAEITGAISGMPLDGVLERFLNDRFGSGSVEFAAIRAACAQGDRAGWMCNREAGGIRFGRVAKPGPDLAGFSIDVVDMQEVSGPHHEHPGGEIDLMMPMEGDARFDGRGAGWLVYGPGSAHRPTVTNGRAYVLYLLPGGEIRFTGQ